MDLETKAYCQYSDGTWTCWEPTPGLQHFLRFWGTSERTTRGSKTRTPPSSESSANSPDETSEDHLHKEQFKVLCSSQAQVRKHKRRRESCTARSTVTGTVLWFHVAFWPLFWHIYCIKGSTAPLVDWWNDPGHHLLLYQFHFYCTFKLRMLSCALSA